jgi:branched-chain amino acid transport system permease protein
MNELLVYVLSGLALAGSFALVGSGIVMVYRVTHVLNFAQGVVAVIGALVSYSLLTMGLPHGLAEALAIGVSAAAGLVVGIAAIGRRGTAPMISLLITLGAAMVGQAIIVWAWGQAPLSPPGLTGQIEILGVALEVQRIAVFVVSLVVFGVLSAFFGLTDLGKALTAAASNPLAARLVGIDTRVMGLVAFAIAGALGGLAGVLISPTAAVSSTSDLPLILSGLAAAIFGGLRSPWLTYLGAVILGVTGQLVAGYAGGSYQTQIALLMMLIIMIARAGRLTPEEAK